MATKNTPATTPTLKPTLLARIKPYALKAAIGLAIFTPLYFGVAALGTKFGLWGWKLGFGKLTFGLGPKLLLLTLAVTAIALILSVLVKPRKDWLVALICLTIPLIGLGLGKKLRSTARSVPPIHDITTSTQNPPKRSRSVKYSALTAIWLSRDLPTAAIVCRWSIRRTSSIPKPTRACARSTRPSLSETEIRARRILVVWVMKRLSGKRADHAGPPITSPSAVNASLSLIWSSPADHKLEPSAPRLATLLANACCRHGSTRSSNRRQSHQVSARAIAASLCSGR